MLWHYLLQHLTEFRYLRYVNIIEDTSYILPRWSLPFVARKKFSDKLNNGHRKLFLSFKYNTRARIQQSNSNVNCIVHSNRFSKHNFVITSWKVDYVLVITIQLLKRKNATLVYSIHCCCAHNFCGDIWILVILRFLLWWDLQINLKEDNSVKRCEKDLKRIKIRREFNLWVIDELIFVSENGKCYNFKCFGEIHFHFSSLNS